jgi:hypothetical protein
MVDRVVCGTGRRRRAESTFAATSMTLSRRKMSRFQVGPMTTSVSERKSGRA